MKINKKKLAYNIFTIVSIGFLINKLNFSTPKRVEPTDCNLTNFYQDISLIENNENREIDFGRVHYNRLEGKIIDFENLSLSILGENNKRYVFYIGDNTYSKKILNKVELNTSIQFIGSLDLNRKFNRMYQARYNGENYNFLPILCNI